MTLRISPMCEREEHEACVWWEIDAELHRTYWCECECHSAGAVIDLTSAPTPDESNEERELVRQE